MYSSLFTTSCFLAVLATTLAVQNFPQIGGGNDFSNLIDQVETADEPVVLSTAPQEFEEFSSDGGDFVDIPQTFVDFGQLIDSVDSQDPFDATTFQTFQNLNNIANFPPLIASPGGSGPGFSLCLVLFSTCVGTCPTGNTCGSDVLGQCTCQANTLPSPPVY